MGGMVIIEFWEWFIKYSYIGVGGNIFSKIDCFVKVNVGISICYM